MSPPPPSQVVRLDKVLFDDTDAPDPLLVWNHTKTHQERTFEGGIYLAIRCEDSGDCAHLAVAPRPAAGGDVSTAFSGDSYTAPDFTSHAYSALARAVLYEDRMMPVNKRYSGHIEKLTLTIRKI